MLDSVPLLAGSVTMLVVGSGPLPDARTGVICCFVGQYAVWILIHCTISDPLLVVMICGILYGWFLEHDWATEAAVLGVHTNRFGNCWYSDCVTANGHIANCKDTAVLIDHSFEVYANKECILSWRWGGRCISWGRRLTIQKRIFCVTASMVTCFSISVPTQSFWQQHTMLLNHVMGVTARRLHAGVAWARKRSTVMCFAIGNGKTNWCWP